MRGRGLHVLWVGVVSLGWACVSCVCASVMWAQDAQPHDCDQPPVHEQALEADRPHFPEARSTVGKGRLLFEGGYTFTTTHVQASPATPICIPKHSCVMA